MARCGRGGGERDKAEAEVNGCGRGCVTVGQVDLDPGVATFGLIPVGSGGVDPEGVENSVDVVGGSPGGNPMKDPGVGGGGRRGRSGGGGVERAPGLVGGCTGNNFGYGVPSWYGPYPAISYPFSTNRTLLVRTVL